MSIELQHPLGEWKIKQQLHGTAMHYLPRLSTSVNVKDPPLLSRHQNSSDQIARSLGCLIPGNTRGLPAQKNFSPPSAKGPRRRLFAAGTVRQKGKSTSLFRVTPSSAGFFFLLSVRGAVCGGQ
ncbi:hypothetical protein K0M31_016963 [Melipona bicolor]|uniref:Uncharacterized protein n=1 Tax=Melipona bicolor TaxID=60889 RepID=A0AA40FE46_9HYME|nr:hypothetical protein K0M31_016963 [Melipona bicolor]